MGGGSTDQSSAQPGSNHNRCLDAVTVALNQVCEGSKWYTSTEELQLASLQFCTACRSVAILTVTVDIHTRRRLLGTTAGIAPYPTYDGVPSSRVPQIRARCLKWNLRTATALRNPAHAAIGASAIEFGDPFEDSLAGIIWPRRLKTLGFSDWSKFNKPVDGVAWPASLNHMTLGGAFNQPLEGVVLPASLEQLILGRSFNQPIQGVQWPASLRRLTFGYMFSQTIGDVSWPDSMVQLTFGSRFEEPLQGVVLPASLEQLTFGEFYDEPVDGVMWPKSLRQLAFGDGFNQPIDEVLWPDSLRQVSFGNGFNQLMDGVIWPASIDTISFGSMDGASPSGVFMYSFFNQALDMAMWPTSLRQLTIGGSFRQSLGELGTWIPSLEELRLLLDDRLAYWLLLGSMQWPKGIRKLTLFEDAFFEEFPCREPLEIEFLTRVE